MKKSLHDSYSFGDWIVILLSLLAILLALFAVVLVVAPVAAFTLDYERGDANRNGSVDMGDTVYIELMILGLVPYSCTADANGDGDVNMGDITAIELMLLGW